MVDTANIAAEARLLLRLVALAGCIGWVKAALYMQALTIGAEMPSASGMLALGHLESCIVSPQKAVLKTAAAVTALKLHLPKDQCD